jgi:hypothetical protein
MGIHAYETAADGSDWDETAANELSAASGKITGVGLYPAGGARYSIFKVGSTYYRRDGLDGIVDDSGAAAHTLINTALTALSNTYYETVQLLGDITLTGDIDVHSGSWQPLYDTWHRRASRDDTGYGD